MTGNRSRLLLALAVLAALGAATLAWWFWPAVASPQNQASTEVRLDEDGPPVSSPKPVQERNAEVQLQEALQVARSDTERLAAVDAYAASKSATSRSPLLRAVMTTGASPDVRVRAFEAALRLALAEDREAAISVLGDGVQSPYAEVRRAGLRACRDHPHYELMDELLAVVERGGPERSVAITALAFLDDPVAQGKVLETAQSDKVSRPERLQAIALLSRSELDEAVDYLKTLAADSDAELADCAIAALAAKQSN